MSNTGMTLIRAHFERIGRRLQAEGEAARSLHHNLNKGLIREAFIREFLEDNTSSLCGIGSGEIIHRSTNSEDPRNQIDVIVYNKRYPKLSMASGIDIFFAETVSSFIEIKSRLDKSHLQEFATVSKEIKSKTDSKTPRFHPSGLRYTLRPYSLVFAYDGPKKIQTLLKWMKEVSTEDEYCLDALRATEPQKRSYFANQFIDGVFVLGTGFVLVDALPVRSPLSQHFGNCEEATLDHIWWCGKSDVLPMLWALINQLSWDQQWSEFDISEYLGNMQWFFSL